MEYGEGAGDDCSPSTKEQIMGLRGEVYEMATSVEGFQACHEEEIVRFYVQREQRRGLGLL